MNQKVFVVAFFLFPVLQGCANTTLVQKGSPVTPGQSFPGAYINITAPNSDEWRLAQSAGSGMEFGKRGPAANESFGAQVLMFNLAPTPTPQDFQNFIEKSAVKDANSSRFKVQKVQVEYSNERSYPCVRYRSVVQDNAPEGLKGSLLLESDGLYCRHPIRQETGFAIIYSHRGESLYANSRVEAESFIQGVQVPGK